MMVIVDKRRLLVSSLILSTLVAASCGRRPNNGGNIDANVDGDGNPIDPDAGTFVDAAPLTLTISPLNPTLDVSGAVKTLPFVARVSGQPSTAVVWTVDDVRVGVVNPTGLFRSEGWVAGSAKVTAKYGTLTASTTVAVRVSIVENPGNLSAADMTALDGGGASNATFAWQYPYNNTVFPRGLQSPDLQFAGGATRGVKVAARVGDFSYTGYFAGSTFARATLPQPIWKALTASSDGTIPVAVEATELTAAGVTGPIAQTWKVAPADLKGIIYYNTYKSALTNTGAVMRVKPGRDAEVMIGGCAVCHSVAANGKVIAAGVQWGNGDPLDSKTYNLAADGSVATRNSSTNGGLFAFGGLTPDGDMMITNGVRNNASPVRGLAVGLTSQLLNTATGNTITAPTFTSQVDYAVTPVFSPDGKHLAFSETNNNRTLSVMDVDLTMSPPSFSTKIPVVTATAGIVGWPSFLPDGKGVIYQAGDGFDTAGYGGTPKYSELRLVSTDNMMINDLKTLNGRTDAGVSYLPYGETEENKRNYEPTILPVPVGGYYWVMFTSRRAYGNTLAPGGSVAGSDNEWGKIVNNTEVPSTRKKIWVAAIDINYSGAIDPSHPAFYLDGQELDAGNMRAFAALEPCRDQGTTCESGTDCCSGFCRPTGTDANGAPILQCVPPPGDCSHTDEACNVDGDCCDVATGTTCINNRCAQPPPVQ
jgi:hypothetical protein